MSTGEDDDIKLQRASASLIADFEHLLPHLLQKRKHGTIPMKLVFKACSLIEPFQEDPQLLDTHLKSFLPPLVAAYLATLTATSTEEPRKDSIPLSHAICYILNIFCKVRGEKVIKGFFNNEPRYLLPILHELETGRNYQVAEEVATSQNHVKPWIERYVLLLWLSHLMLAPFPLESMSGLQPSEGTSTLLGIEFPPEAPAITLQVIALCVQRMQSASKERGAAANLLVKLCARPDMQNLGLLDILVQWSVSFFDQATENQTDIHQCLGILTFLSGLVMSTTNEEIGSSLPPIYRACRNIIDQESLTFIKFSAVARKIIVKILRNIVVHCLQPASTMVGLDTTSVVEEVIEFLLEAVADGDTPVRYGASKALSIITLKLDKNMAEEVIEAILGSLNESVYWQGSKRNLSGVNALRWHGLTLTLSHLLYRKAISANSLPDVLNALLLSLSFEQRSPTGGSIGTNVRDSACFGVWALSRRYATSDFLNVSTSSIRACQYSNTLSAPQALAIELVAVACLDPAGNIRRGSSAALQELIGRHPNTIEQGISLVQVVDFHAVGLRQRAMCDVAIRAGELHSLYWVALFDNLLGWRGTGSLDTDSRLSAAKAVGLLSNGQPVETIQRMSTQICNQLASLRPREIEERQGLVSSLAFLVNAANTATSPHMELDTEETALAFRETLLHLWQLLETNLKLEDKAFTSPALRPELTASSISFFIGTMASMTNRIPKSRWPADIPVDLVAHALNLCLARHEDTVLQATIVTVPAVMSLFSVKFENLKQSIIGEWLSNLENEASYNGLRCSGHAIALGSAYSVVSSSALDGSTVHGRMDTLRRIVEVLTFRCTSAVAIEARTMALRALAILVGSSSQLEQGIESQITTALHIALNDYTITERGDVGSLVRIEALEAVRAGWAAGILQPQASEIHQRVYADVLRLSLEKLDKIRTIAARVLKANSSEQPTHVDTPQEDVSSRAYFLGAMKMFRSATLNTIQEAICLGFINSAGMGSESVAQNARDALLSFLDPLPAIDISESPEPSLADIAACILTLLKDNLDNDRVTIPLLETIAFLFDMQILQRLVSSPFSFRSLLSLTQKSHFKSSHMQKLHLALGVYRGLGTIPATRMDTLTKVTNMLLHPFPMIRMAAAETLWILTHEEVLKIQDWSLPSKSLKPVVESIKNKHLT
ncbi:tubulin folding cofactor D C terminal-domain-containing protein [Phaeosphaeriaceae sp. PMI808]|nr:tubulin folding cofactor D C terminal-domain-containing protein [Phaeosphaeriaceae sp. PMI808]